MTEFINAMNHFFSTDGVKIAQALTLLIFGLILINLIKKLARGILIRLRAEKALITFSMSVIRVVLYLVLFFMVANLLGVSVTSYVTILSAVVLSISLALKDSLSNVANGVIILYSKPFKVEDEVIISGITGTVTEISIFATTIVTADNKVITIPNSTVISDTITNCSAKEIRRITISITISFDEDVKKTEQILQETARTNNDVLKNPAPFAIVSAYHDGAITIDLRVWTPSAEYWNVYNYLYDEIVTALKQNNVSLAKPALSVNVEQAGKEDNKND